MMMQEEMQAFVDRRIAAAHQFLTTRMSDELPQAQVEAFDAAVGDLGIEFSWMGEEGTGTFAVRMIGVINGLLARNDQTLMMQYDENDRFIGLKVADRTRFGRSIDVPPESEQDDRPNI